jgi:hypothetical protein
MAEERPKASPEDLAKTLARAGVPQSVFFYVALGVVSTFRKCVYMAIEESCPPAEPDKSPGGPATAPGEPSVVQ